MSQSQTTRPLSPHLQIWKWTTNMTLSILHRASGIVLSLGSLMLVWMLLAAAGGKESYQGFLEFAASWVGQICLFGWTAALYYHLCSGVRHLIMDAGYMISIPATEKAGLVIFVVTGALTLATWGCLKFFY